ncbi:MAG: hypothetical protein OEX11_03800 [Nitrosomonas sp.]|nr:hypothetical protein [Nitrosomonas sp.]
MSNDTHVFIDTLNIKLPSGFEGRSNAIARETVHQLSNLSVMQNTQLATINVPKIKLHGGEANGVIARRIAHAIQEQINTPHAHSKIQGSVHVD